MVVVDILPETVSLTLERAINQANQGLMNWMFQHRGMRLLSILSLPYVLPADVAYATFLKYLKSIVLIFNMRLILIHLDRFVDSAPAMIAVGYSLKELADSLVTFLLNVLEVVRKRTPCNTQLSCQLALTEYSDGIFKKLFLVFSKDYIYFFYFFSRLKWERNKCQESSQLWFHLQPRV